MVFTKMFDVVDELLLRWMKLCKDEEQTRWSQRTVATQHLEEEEHMDINVEEHLWQMMKVIQVWKYKHAQITDG